MLPYMSWHRLSTSLLCIVPRLLSLGSFACWLLPFIRHPPSVIIDSLYPSITSMYTSHCLKSVPSGPKIWRNNERNNMRGLWRIGSSFNLENAWSEVGRSRIPLILRFFWLVTQDNITYISARENAFWMLISTFDAIVAPCNCNQLLHKLGQLEMTPYSNKPHRHICIGMFVT